MSVLNISLWEDNMGELDITASFFVRRKSTLKVYMQFGI